jgi:hypothetical protein
MVNYYPDGNNGTQVNLHTPKQGHFFYLFENKRRRRRKQKSIVLNIQVTSNYLWKKHKKKINLTRWNETVFRISKRNRERSYTIEVKWMWYALIVTSWPHHAKCVVCICEKNKKKKNGISRLPLVETFVDLITPKAKEKF